MFKKRSVLLTQLFYCQFSLTCNSKSLSQTQRCISHSLRRRHFKTMQKSPMTFLTIHTSIRKVADIKILHIPACTCAQHCCPLEHRHLETVPPQLLLSNAKPRFHCSYVPKEFKINVQLKCGSVSSKCTNRSAARFDCAVNCV